MSAPAPTHTAMPVGWDPVVPPRMGSAVVVAQQVDDALTDSDDEGWTTVTHVRPYKATNAPLDDPSAE